MRFPSARSGALCAALVCAGVGLAAQEAGDRAAIERLQDSLAGTTDSIALRRLEAVTVQAAKT